jgi:MFS-type transporter involved in bile tolerance (Atg22 family)
MIALFARAAAFTTVSLLWLLFVKDMFDWTPTEFAGALFAVPLVSVLCVGAFPYLEKRFRGLRVAVILTLISIISALFAFTFSRRGDLDKLLHVLLTVVFLAATATLEPCLKSLGSLFSPASAQERSFGVMATVSGAGQMVGNSAGAYLYHLSTTATVEHPNLAPTTWLAFMPTWFYHRGTLPLLCTSILVLVATAAVSVVTRGTHSRV